MSSSASAELLPLHPSQNPSNWRFTWETQSQIPAVRLYLFNPHTNPSAQCADLKVDLILDQSSLLVSFTQAEAEAGAETSLRVPLPRVLIDPDSSVHFRAYDDHIQVKLALLLPIDHPLVSEFDSASDEFRPLSADSDLKKLSALEEVYFYCRSCSTKLTRSLRCFKEMPSVNWQEAADNWFGACCCSFGGISEKLVSHYAKSYTCAAGLCLLDAASVILCKDDLVGCEFPVCNSNESDEINLKLTNNDILAQASLDNVCKQGEIICSKNDDFLRQDIDEKEHHLGSKEDNLKVKQGPEATEVAGDCGSLSCLSSKLQVAQNVATCPDFHTDGTHDVGYCDNGCCSLDRIDISSKEKKSGRNIELLAHQKVLLNGFLWNGFMARSSNISKDVQWIEFLCPQCSSLLGAYPCFSDRFPLDSGVRLFKCHIATTLPVGCSDDVFRYYSLDRMFAMQLLETAKDELSFRTVVREIQTNHPALQIILLNPDSWCYSGCCLYFTEPASQRGMYPTIKVLFSAWNDKENESRKLEEWITKNQAEEVYMLPSQIRELITFLESANSTYPPSQVPLQNMCLSSMRR